MDSKAQLRLFHPKLVNGNGMQKIKKTEQPDAIVLGYIQPMYA